MTQFAERIDVMANEVVKLNSLAGSITAGDMVSLAVGAPAVEAYPIDTLREISQDVFQNSPRGVEALKYGSTYGFTRLREAVRDILLAPRGLKADVENIMITSGGIQPMSLMSQLFIDPGDTILVETPSFVHASMVFKMFEANLVPCAMDDNGLVTEDVEEKIKKYNPKMIYTIPTFQNPTGVTMSLERRKKLAQLASWYDVIVLEDDPYREIRYSGEHLPYIKSFDTTGNVVLANSFSKIFSPGSRLGYIVADPEILKHLADIKLAVDTCANTISQALVSEFFLRGCYPAHLKKLCDMYRSRRDVMLESLDRYFPEGTKHTRPDGGFYVWAQLPGSLDASALSEEIAKKLNICYGLGSAFYTEGNPEGAGRNCMRLNFSSLTEDVIRDSIKKLGDFFKSKLQDN